MQKSTLVPEVNISNRRISVPCASSKVIEITAGNAAGKFIGTNRQSPILILFVSFSGL